MKILLSAYACEPNKGSEPGVGWHWALELPHLGHEVWVLTRANNRSVIEAEFLHQQLPPNLNFFYYDLPAWAKWWKKGGQGVHLYYLIWQWGAYCLAKKKHAEIQFDMAHHVTFVSVRQPSFLGNLSIPFIFGPVGGGERAPLRLRFGYGLRGFLRDALRDLANLMIKIDPLMRRTFKQASKIYATSRQTHALIPEKYRYKTMVQLAIGIDMGNPPEKLSSSMLNDSSKLRILYVGHFLFLKGMHLGLQAFARLITQGIDAQLTMVGKGPDVKLWQKLSEKLGISNRIAWLPWVSQDELSIIYAQNDVFLFPSLHDSGGMVVLEALAQGLPVVCFDLGGPGQIVDSSCGQAVSVLGLSEQETVIKLANALAETGRDAAFRAQISEGARTRAQDFAWPNVVRRIYSQGKLPC